MNAATVVSIANQSLEATRLHAMKHGIALIDREDGYAPASGTLIQLGEHYFIATAGHVIPAVPNKRIWIIGSKGSWEAQGFPSFVRFGTAKHGVPDVGFLELNPEVAKPYLGEQEFCTIEQICDYGCGRKDRVCLVSGNPSDHLKKKTINQDSRLLTAKWFWFGSTPLMTTEWPNLPADAVPCNPSMDIFFEWPDDEALIADGFSPINLPNPKGMSGGAMWDEGFEQGKIWDTAHSKLFGIQSEWFPDLRVIRGVQILHWLRLVFEHFEDLRPLLLEHFPELEVSPAAV